MYDTKNAISFNLCKLSSKDLKSSKRADGSLSSENLRNSASNWKIYKSFYVLKVGRYPFMKLTKNIFFILPNLSIDKYQF